MALNQVEAETFIIPADRKAGSFHSLQPTEKLSSSAQTCWAYVVSPETPHAVTHWVRAPYETDKQVTQFHFVQVFVRLAVLGNLFPISRRGNSKLETVTQIADQEQDC